MKIITNIIKGILFYTTLIYWILAVITADSYTSIGILIVFGVGFTLIYLCKTFLTLKDITKLIGSDIKDIENETI